MAFRCYFEMLVQFLQVLMDPNEFDKLQSSLYPSFQKMNAQPMMIGVSNWIICAINDGVL